MSFYRSGKFWMNLWIIEFLGMAIWGVLTVLFLMDSVRNLNMLSVAALIVAVQGGIQTTLTMRKADDSDKF